MKGKLESGYEYSRHRMGLATRKRIGLSEALWMLSCCCGGVATVAVFLWWLGGMQFWR